MCNVRLTKTMSYDHELIYSNVASALIPWVQDEDW